MRVLASFAVASAFVGLSTQTTVQDLNFTVDINKVGLGTLNSWCTGQINVCDTLCSQDTKTITCNEEPLNWECTCSDDSSPDLLEWQISMPSQLCNAALGQCLENNAGELAEQMTCNNDIKPQCGTKNIEEFEDDSNETSTTTTTTTTTEPTATDEGSSNTSPEPTSEGLAPTTVAFARGGAAAIALGLLVQQAL